MSECYEEIAELLISIGWKSSCDAQWDGLRDALPQLREVLSAAPAQEAEPVCWVNERDLEEIANDSIGHILFVSNKQINSKHIPLHAHRPTLDKVKP